MKRIGRKSLEPRKTRVNPVSMRKMASRMLSVPTCSNTMSQFVSQERKRRKRGVHFDVGSVNVPLNNCRLKRCSDEESEMEEMLERGKAVHQAQQSASRRRIIVYLSNFSHGLI